MIDHEIAVEVMGWHKGYASWLHKDNYTTGFVTGYKIGRFRKEPVFMPSTNIAHAWMVVESIRELGWEFSIGTLDDNKWEVRLCDNKGKFLIESDAEIYRRSTNICLAICEAALSAVREGK